MKKIIILLFFILCWIATGCGDSNHQKSTLIPVDLALNWYPEVEHGGFYAALIHGYYREQGLDVTIIPGGPGTAVLQNVARGNISFGVSNADKVLLAKSQQAKVVVVMAPIQKSPRCMMFHESSSITDLEQMQNMTVFMSISSSFAQYIKYKLPLKGVTIAPYKGSLMPFLTNKNSAQQAYLFSEPFIAKKHGVAVRSILLADALKFNPYTSVLIVKPEYIKKNKEVVRKIVIASQKGWQTYIATPKKTNEYIHSLNPEISKETLSYGVQTLKPLVFDGLINKKNLGIMTQERWEKLRKEMYKAKIINLNAAVIKDVFSNQFLQSEK